MSNPEDSQRDVPRLFIPGPVEVEDSILQAMTRPMIGHRAPEFSVLGEELHTNSQRLFRTKDPVYVLTSSGTLLRSGSTVLFLFWTLMILFTLGFWLTGILCESAGVLIEMQGSFSET